jgi:hypothetical protein
MTERCRLWDGTPELLTIASIFIGGNEVRFTDEEGPGKAALEPAPLETLSDRDSREDFPAFQPKGC